jgi:hypothetical protein
MAWEINRARRDRTRSAVSTAGRAAGRLLLPAFQAPGTIDNPAQAGDEDSDGDAHARQEKDGRDGETNCIRDIGELGAGLHDRTSGQRPIRDARTLQPFTPPSIPQVLAPSPRAPALPLGHTRRSTCRSLPKVCMVVCHPRVS